VRDLLRVLKPGGKLLIEEPDITKLQVKMVAWAEKLALMKSHFHTPEEIRKMVANHGYQAKVESDEEYAIWVIVEK
jgi:predicted SAM-dependent methyltransferase